MFVFGWLVYHCCYRFFSKRRKKILLFESFRSLISYISVSSGIQWYFIGTNLNFRKMSRKETESAVNVVQDGSQSSSCVRRTCESDSCWSWLVCGVCALCNIIICGLTYSYGILFPSLLDEFKQGKATTGMRTFFSWGAVNTSWIR